MNLYENREGKREKISLTKWRKYTTKKKPLPKLCNWTLVERQQVPKEIQELCTSSSVPKGIHFSAFSTLIFNTNPKHTHAFTHPCILQTLPLLPIHGGCALSHSLMCQVSELSSVFYTHSFTLFLATQKSCEDCSFPFSNPVLHLSTDMLFSITLPVVLLKLFHLAFVGKRSREQYLLSLAQI